MLILTFLLFKTSFEKTFDNSKNYQEAERLPIKIEFDFSLIDEKNDPFSCNNDGDIIKNIIDGSFYNCTIQDLYDISQINRIKRIVNKSKIFLESLIKINKPNQKNLLIELKNESISQKKKESESDLFISIALRHFSYDLIAIGKAISYSPIDLRPTQGVLYLEISAFNYDDEDSDLEYPGIEFSLIQPIISILGFSEKDFPKWMNRETGKPWGDNFPYKKIKNPLYANMEFPIIFTPQLHNYAKNRWNNDEFVRGELNGIELYMDEKYKEYGCYLSGRVFDNELLVFQKYGYPSVLSDVTLLILEDMGWYSTNFSMAKPLTWGAGELLEEDKKKYFNSSPPQLVFPKHYEFEPDDVKSYMACSHDYSSMEFSGAYLQTNVDCNLTSPKYNHDYCENQVFYNPFGSKYRGDSKSNG